MATVEQLKTALKNADAAGDAEAARRFAAALRGKMSAPAQPAEPMVSTGGETMPMSQVPADVPVGEAAQQVGQPQSSIARPGPMGAQRDSNKFIESITGSERMTPEMESLDEIGSAPEINAMSMDAVKASLGLLTTGNTEQLKSIFKQQFGDNVSFSQDAKGNEIVNFPSGSYALNKPGLSPQDVARGIFDITAFTPAGRATSVVGAGVKSAATQTAMEAGKASVGGDFESERIIAAGGLGSVGKAVERGVGAGYRAIRGRGQVRPERRELLQAGEAEGIPMMTSDVIEPQTFAGRMAQQTGEKIPFAGTGGMRQTQQLAREEAVDQFTQKYGEFSYPAIVNSLKSQKNRVKKAAGSVLESTGRKLDEVGEIPLENTRQAIDQAVQELNRKGVIQSGSALDDLAVLVRSLDEGPQTFSTLKENRTLFREILKGVDKAERTQLNSRAKGLLERVGGAMKRDMDKFAQRNLTDREFNRWQRANRAYANEAEKLTRTRLKNVLDKGDVTPENVQNLLFSRKPSEVKTLYQSLTNEGRQNARAAIIQKVVDNLQRRSSGLTPNSFASEMKKFGLQTDTFFKGSEGRQLRGLLKALNATRRAQDAAVTTPTGQAVLGAGSGYAMWADPVTTLGAGGTLGTLSRLYESKPVRDILLKIDGLPPGSTKFEQALRELNGVLTPAIQAAREEIQDKE